MASSRPERQSWKRRRTTSSRATAPPSRRGARWTLTVAAVVMTVLLVWVVSRLFTRADRTHVVALLAGNHAKLSVPSVPFGRHDWRPVSETMREHLKFYDWSPLLQADRFDEFGRDLERLGLGSRDTLVVYVSAHGVSNLANDDQAHILCRDFDLNQPERSRMALDRLLEQLGKSSAERKLLVLDTGYLPSDSRLGMLVNEFPRHVRRAVERASEHDVWVLLSNDVFESNTVLADNSAFGQSLVEALLGAANTNGDKQVDLGELFQYVAANCLYASGGRQHVQLLRTGSASLNVPPDSNMPFPVSTIERVAKEEPAPAADAPSEPAPQGEPTARAASNTSTRLTAQSAPPDTADAAPPAEASSDAPVSADAPQGAPATPVPNGQPAAAPPEAPAPRAPDASTSPADPPTSAHGDAATASQTDDRRRRMRADLDRAWQLRDQLQDMSSDGSDWLPLEFAPQLWRELNRLLVDSELWLIGGTNDSLALQVEKHVEGLEALVAGRTTEGATKRASAGDLVTDRLLRARARFEQSPERQQFDSASGELAQTAHDLRRLRRIEYFLPDYVHWYALAAFATPDDEDQLDRLIAERIERLIEGCAEQRELVQQHQGRPIPTGLAAQVRDRADELAETHRQLQSRIAEQMAQAMASPQVPAYRRRLTTFLQTSLPTHEQRSQIRSVLAGAAKLDVPASVMDVPATARSSVSPTQWQRLVRYWRMEEQLFQRVSPAFQRIPPPPSFVESDALWQEIRAAGRRFQSAYLDLAGGEGAFAGLPDAIRMQGVDGRDVPAIAQLEKGFPELALLPPAAPPRLELAWSTGSELPLSGEWEDVELSVATTAREALPVTLGFQFDPSGVELQTASGQTVQPGSYPPFELTRSRSLALRMRARMTVTEPGASALRTLTVVAHASNLRAEAQLRCILPHPDDVELLVTRVGATQPELSVGGDDQMVLLRAHPNRTTHFRLQLRNRSGLPKSVQARLVAIPVTQRAKWPPGRIWGADQQPLDAIVRLLFEPDRRRLLPDLQVLASTSEPLALPADGSPVDLTISTPAPPPPPPQTAPADASTPLPVARPAVDISQGLLCVLEEGDKRWLKWIELQPIPPRDYLRVRINYDLQRLAIQLQPRAADRLPLGLEQAPIPIAWEIDRLIEEQLKVGDRVETGILATQDDVVQLYADVGSSRDRPASVRLGVDGFPRAFIFEVPLDRRSEQEDPRRDLPELVIQSVAVSDFPRVYVTSEAERRALLARRSAEDQREIVVLRPNEPAAFPKPDIGDEMEIRLRADASVSAFGRADNSDQIVVQLNDRLGVTTFEETRYADRQSRFQLLELKDGRLSVQTQVDDHRIVTGTQRMEGDYQLIATMRVGGEELRYPRIPVVFDGQPPHIRRPLAVTPPQTDVGKPVDVSLEVTDQSGIAKLEIGLVKTLTDPLDEQSKFVLEGPRDPLVRARLSAEEPGDYWVKAVITDRVGHVTQTELNGAFAPVRVRFRTPAPATPDTEKKVVGRVFGVTQIGNRKIDRIQVTLKGDQDFPPVTTNNGGMFEFHNVPAGKYTLSAEGYWNGERVGELPLDLKAASDYGPHVIVLKAKPRDENAK